MDDNNRTLLTAELLLSDKSDSEIIMECERDLQEIMNKESLPYCDTIEKTVEKRLRDSDDGSSEEGYMTITRRRRPKRLIRSESTDMPQNEPTSPILPQHTEVRKSSDMNQKEKEYEVSLTSLKALPKQMALARFLRSENVTNIIGVKYRSPYKVYVKFDDKTQADNLIKCPKLPELEIRAQLTDEGMLSYGLIKGVDLEMSEGEIQQSLTSSVHIISVKRLRRVSDGKWIDSETVRLCFKSTTCPAFISAYGCRFAVERYVFPVTQCSGCWKYGHTKKFCPMNKCLCPKCGKPHDNCEVETYTCINCKGPHMAFDKYCPFFSKEKEIRILMSEENITYKKALELYSKNEEGKEQEKVLNFQQEFPPLRPPKRNTATSILPIEETTQQVVTEKNVSEPEDKIEEEGIEHGPRWQKKKKIRREKKVEQPSTSQSQVNEDMDVEIPIELLQEKNAESISQREGNEQGKTRYARKELEEKDYRDRKKEKRFDWRKLFERIRDIAFSEQLIVDKVIRVVKYLFEELSSYVLRFFAEGDILKRMFQYS